MELRLYREEDAAVLAQLFYDTVHTINALDYTPQQLDAWAPVQRDLTAWHHSLASHVTVVALIDETIVGFGDMDAQGYLDRLYVHKVFQRRGIATAIMDELERAVSVPTYAVQASVTAMPFFARRGYQVLRVQQVSRNGVILKNFWMEK